MRMHATEYQLQQKKKIRNVLLIILLLLLFRYLISQFDQRQAVLVRSYAGVVERMQQTRSGVTTAIWDEGIVPVLGSRNSLENVSSGDASSKT